VSERTAEPTAPGAAASGAPDRWAGRRVVLVHDWLTGMRGGEKVLESLCRIFPSADLLTLVHKRGSVSDTIAARRIRTSFIQRLPGSDRLYRHYLPLFPTAIEAFDLDHADLVVSTSHCAAKAVVPTGRAVHVCYCHSPMRYAWDQFDAYFGPDRLGRTGTALARPVMAWLARWDRATAGRVHQFVANSQFVAGRINRYYNRRATVLYPPVDTQFFTPGPTAPQSYFLVVSALVPYKRIDIAIRSAMRLGVRLKIVGAGPDLERLRALAGPTVEFLGSLPPAELREAYQHATSLVLPGTEDFGIAPVEAMACGRPVIALGQGGALETVKPGVTGWLVDEPSDDGFAAAMAQAENTRLDPVAIATHAAQFSVDRFEAGLRAILARADGGAASC
jgi:glycosyltransferase involved in cell wall biosynthesis